MEFLLPITMITIGFAILIFGGEALVKASVSIAAKFNISPAVIGLTIVAAGTSAPEMVTSLFAALKDAPDVAMGNIVGSNVFNILAILGIASLIKPNRVAPSMARIELPMLILCTLILIGLTWDLVLDPMEGYSCLAILATLLYISLYRAKKVGYHEEEDDIVKLDNYYWDVGYLFVGVAMLVGGAHLALEGGIELGRLIGLSERVIGISIISIGTGLPELATSAVAAYRGRNDIAVANVIGSNLMNTMGVAGIASAFKTISISEKIAHFDNLVLLTITVLLVPIVVLGKMAINRAMGFVMVLGYCVYLGHLLWQ